VTVLVFGANGQVGRALALMPGVLALSRAEADLERPGACADAIGRHDITAVINAAAYTAVDTAETDRARAERINGAAPGEMADAAAQKGLPLIHISTDYVFDGDGTEPFSPDSPIAPLNAYGVSKAMGEQAVRGAGGVHGILRTSWVFSGQGANFVTTMLRLSQTRDHLNVVADQTGGPTPALAIAKACMVMAETLENRPEHSGTYHFSGAPDVTWHDFATEIFTQAKRPVAVTPIPTSAYPTPARRPLNSRLDCTTTLAVFGIVRPDWRAALTDILKDSST